MDKTGSDAPNKFSDICRFNVTFTSHVGRESFGRSLFGKAKGSFVIATIAINNKSNFPISTNPTFWKLELDNQMHSSHRATFFYDIAYYKTEVMPGGTFSFPLVYAVLGDVKKLRNSPATIHYTGRWEA
jgi:hypothetical protein